MNCPVCNKEIKTKSHIRRIKDEKHKKYVIEQEKLAFELYEKYKILYKVLEDDRIFLNEYITIKLKNVYGEEIKKTNKKIRLKKLSNVLTNINSKKYKFNQQYLNDINNGIENINYVTCKICGYKGRQLTSHLNRIHNINKQQYLKMYPNSKIICKNTSSKLKEHMLKNNPNNDPNSIFKMKQTKLKTKERRSQIAKLQFLNGERKIPISNGRGLGGKREDLNEYFRSMWEANFARLLNLKNIKYKYEQKIPIYDNNNNLLCTYVPDFYLPELNHYIEIKGKWENSAKKKIQLLKKYKPEIKLFIIDGTKYKNIEKLYINKISLWETSKQNIKNKPELYKIINKG